MMPIDWRALLGFEARYLLRRWSFVVLTLSLCGFAGVMVATGYAADGIAVNAPTAVMQSLGLLSLWALFTQTILTVHAVLRDTEHGMVELIDSRPASRGRVLLVRAGGAAAGGILAFGIATAFLAFAPYVAAPDAARVAPLRLAAYAVPFLTLVIPNVLLVTAMVIAIAAVWRSSMATYVGAVGLFAAYMLTALAVSSPVFAGGAPATPDALARASLLDPFGLSAYFEQSRYWTLAQREREIVSLTGRFVINRVVWLATGFLVLLLALRRLASPPGQHSRRDRTTREAAVQQEGAAARRALHAVIPSDHGFGAMLYATWRMEVRLLLASWPIRTLVLGLIVVVAIELVQNLGAGEYGTRLLATSSELARRATDPIAALGVLSLVYLAGETMWRERAVRIEQLLDASPRSNGVAVWGKLLALVTLMIVFVAVALLVAIGMQRMLGGAAIEPAVYLAHAGKTLWPLTLWAIVLGALHVVAGNRWGGMLLGVLLVVLYLAGSNAGFEHPMTRFPSAPDIRWSDLDGFGPNLRSFTFFLSYWTVAAVSIAIVASGLWPRGAIRSLRHRVRRAWRTGERRGRWVIAAASVAAAGAAGCTWQATWAGGKWRGREATLEWRAGYERQYRRLLNHAQPGVKHADLEVQVRPGIPRVDVTGTLLLQSAETRPIDTLWFFVDPDAHANRLETGTHHAVRPDARYPMYAIALSHPLGVGDTLSVRYQLSYDQSRVSATGFDRMLTRNGSFLTTDDLMPSIGYRGRMEIPDSTTRARFSLGSATPQLQPHRPAAGARASDPQAVAPPAWMTSRVVVVTDSAQVPLATGELVRSWLTGDRRGAEFTLDSPTAPRIAVLSTRYTVRRRSVGTTTVEMWYHPSHSENVDRVLDAATTSLRVMGRQLGPYPRRTLRIAELPTGWGFGAFAMPGTILLTEDRGMRLDARRESVDLLLRRIGHEVAHQWWGNEVVPADVEGAGLIVEGLAKFSEQRIVATVHGDAALAAILAFDHDRYLVGRGLESGQERPLADAGYVDDYLYYGKAAVGFNALHSAIGDSAMTRALRGFFSAHRGPGGEATTDMLREALKAQLRSPEHSALLDEWLDQRVIHDLAIDSATVESVGGRYRVIVRGHAERTSTSTRGEVSGPAGAIGISVRLSAKGGQRSRGAAAWNGVALTAADGSFVLEVALPSPPSHVELDPDFLRIDRNRSNNERALELRGSKPAPR